MSTMLQTASNVTACVLEPAPYLPHCVPKESQADGIPPGLGLSTTQVTCRGQDHPPWFGRYTGAARAFVAAAAGTVDCVLAAAVAAAGGCTAVLVSGL